MAQYVGLTKQVHPNGDVTYTNIYDGSKQHITKEEYERKQGLSDKENEREIERDFKAKKGH